MKCSKCGNDFNGKFCSECGNKNEYETPEIQTNKGRKLKKKPFYLRIWFIIIAVIAVIIFVNLISNNESVEKIKWSEILLGEMLPEPPSNRGSIYENSKEELNIRLDDVSEKEYDTYLKSCLKEGFDIDVDETSFSYKAYNSEGYCLDIGLIGDSLTVKLNIPMELSEITWPISNVGKLLPTPKSTIGKFSYENESGFFVYIGDTTKKDYQEYVNDCTEKGFTVNYNKGDNYYYAYNSEGFYISLKYQGNNIMSISIDKSSEEIEDDNTSVTSEDSKSDEQSEKPKADTVSDEFKKTMDSYEEFMNEYVDFMKKYKENPSDANLLAEYPQYISKYSEFVENFKALGDKEMTTSEALYYSEVQIRVSQKLLEVAQ